MHHLTQPATWLIALLLGIAIALIAAALILTADTLNRPPPPAPTTAQEA